MPDRLERDRWVVSRLVIVVVAVAALAAPASARVVRVAGGASDGPIAAFNGVVAWSAWDAAAGGYRIVVDRGGTQQVLAAASSPVPFDISAGPGPDGATWLVWSRCTDGRSGHESSSDCDVRRWDLARPGERPVAVASSGERREYAPAIWHDRIAFASVSAGGRLAELAIAPVTGGRVRLVRGMPVGSCYGGTCGPARRASVIALALRRNELALSASYYRRGGDGGICGLQEVRLVQLSSGRNRLVAPTMGCGLSGSRYGGLAIDPRGDVWYARTCDDDNSACVHRSGPFRYTPSTGRTAALPGAGDRIVGLAHDGTTVVVAVRGRAAGSCWTPDGSGYLCGVVERVGGASTARLTSAIRITAASDEKRQPASLRNGACR